MKKVVIDSDNKVSVILEGGWIEIQTNGGSLYLDREHGEKVANGILTVLKKNRRKDNEQET